MHRNTRSGVALMLTLCLGLALTSVRALGQTTTLLPDRVEEDWQLVVGTPDTVLNGPQITTTMCPSGSPPTSPFVAFDMNYREYPSFQTGGLQVQVWSGKQMLGSSTQGSAQFSTSNETITWTQAMSLQTGTITYGINNGQSTTFGKFGQGNGLLAQTFASSLSDLSGYSPTTSVKHSGATWKSNVVTSMTLVQVRYYKGGQLISTDTTQRQVILPP